MDRKTFLKAGALAALAAPLGGRSLGARTRPPNVVFVLTDDQERTSLKYMPKLRREFGEKGRTFRNTIIASPLCGVSRATTQTGMYAHNHRVWTNLGPTGGYERMRALGLDRDTAAVRLRAAGYQTAHAGKYQNGYGGWSVPPGWDRWFTKVQDKDRMARGSGDWVPITGHLPSGDGMTRDKVFDWLPKLSADPRPFFLQVGLYAPHGPADYQGRYEDLFRDLRVPRTPDYDEEDMSDKPAHMRLYNRLTDQEKRDYDELYRRKLRASRFVDSFLGRLFGALESLGALGNTYVFFHTDNGVHMGAHRLEYGKNAPYDTDVRFPLLVRGPGVTPGRDDRMVGNQDLVPTFTAIGRAEPVAGADGESMLPLFGGGDAPWRDFAFSEKLVPETGKKRWELARNQRYSYISHATGEEEFYDLRNDPYEVESRHDDPALSGDKETLKTRLSTVR